MENVFFENQYAKVYFDKVLNTVFLEYKSKVPSHKEFLTVNENVISCFKGQQTQKFVADIRKMGIISLESQQWVADVLLPTLLKHLRGKPLIHAQFLDEKDVMVKVSANGVKKRSAQAIENFQLHQFSDWNKLKTFLTTV
jgi:hypothetical protein